MMGVVRDGEEQQLQPGVVDADQRVRHRRNCHHWSGRWDDAAVRSYPDPDRGQSRGCGRVAYWSCCFRRHRGCLCPGVRQTMVADVHAADTADACFCHSSFVDSFFSRFDHSPDSIFWFKHSPTKMTKNLNKNKTRWTRKWILNFLGQRKKILHVSRFSSFLRQIENYNFPLFTQMHRLSCNFGSGCFQFCFISGLESVCRRILFSRNFTARWRCRDDTENCVDQKKISFTRRWAACLPWMDSLHLVSKLDTNGTRFTT